MLIRTLVIALALALSTAPARAEEDAASPEASAAPSASASAEPAPAPASPSPAASAGANDTRELQGTYAYDIDYVLEQQPEFAKFTQSQKEQARAKAIADSPKLEIVISADHVKISENGTVKTDATYTVTKKAAHAWTLAMTEGKDKKTDQVNFELTGTRLKMAKDGEKDALVWVKK